VLPDLFSPLVEIGLDGFNKFVQAGAILGIDIGDGNAGSGLAANNPSKASLVLDNAVGDTHLAAQGGEEQHQLKKTKIL